MASGGHAIAQQRPNVESRIKGLVNQDLKEICKAYNFPVSGTKAILQRRCITILDEIVAKGDPAGFETFRVRVANHGLVPVGQSSTSAGYGAAAGYRPNNSMAPGGGARLYGDGGAPRLNFRTSCFYEKLEAVLKPQNLPGGPEMPQNRHTVRAELRLNDDIARRLKEDESLKLLMYCGVSTGINDYTMIDVAFPNQIEVKVNNDDVKSNFKGLKNKPGSTKPADVTQYVRKTAGYANQISVCYALTTKRYAFEVQLVRHHAPASLIRKIQSARVIPKQKVLDEMNRANADPDIAATSSKMSLKDPVSTMRISIPIRATVCTHNQCFDGDMFLQLQEQAPTWSCPICSKTVSFESLCVDKYFEEILNNTGKSVEQVTIEPDGQWSVEKEDEDKGKSNRAKGEARAAYDDDFDDDLVEVTEPPNGQTNGIKPDWSNGYTASPLHPAFPINTPPLSSREASVASAQRPATASKRAANAVIDLTLSDEDEPPRPAKRHQTGNPSHHHQTTTHSYSTPSSIPADPPPRQQSAYTQQPAESSAIATTTHAPSFLPRPSSSSAFAHPHSPSPYTGASQFNLPPPHPPGMDRASQSPVQQRFGYTTPLGPPPGLLGSVLSPSVSSTQQNSPYRDDRPRLPMIGRSQQQQQGGFRQYDSPGS